MQCLSRACKDPWYVDDTLCSRTDTSKTCANRAVLTTTSTHQLLSNCRRDQHSTADARLCRFVVVRRPPSLRLIHYNVHRTSPWLTRLWRRQRCRLEVCLWHLVFQLVSSVSWLHVVKGTEPWFCICVVCLSRDNYVCWIFLVFRLRRMHEMQNTDTAVSVVSLSVTRLNSASLCKNGWTEQDLIR